MFVISIFRIYPDFQSGFFFNSNANWFFLLTVTNRVENFFRTIHIQQIWLFDKNIKILSDWFSIGLANFAHYFIRVHRVSFMLFYESEKFLRIFLMFRYFYNFCHLISSYITSNTWFDGKFHNAAYLVIKILGSWSNWQWVKKM